MKPRRTLMTGILIAILTTIALHQIGCSQDQGPLKIGYIPIAECVPLYVAVEKEYFQDRGLEVELIPLAGGAKILSALNSGSVDVGFSNVVSLILQRAHDSEFYSVFGATYETPKAQNHAILTRSDVENASPRSILEGATIALNTRNNIEELMVRKYLDSIGISWDEVEPVEVAFPRMLPLLEAGTVDAVSIVEPFITIATEEESSRVRWLCNQYLTTTERTLVATYVSSRRAFESRQKDIQQFIDAMSEATNYIATNEGESREIIGSYTKIPRELLTKIGLPEFSDRIDERTLQDVIDDMVRYGYLEGLPVPSPGDLIWRGKENGS